MWKNSILLTVSVLFATTALSQAEQYIDLGNPGLCLDQPRVAIEVYQSDPVHSFGPTYFNTFLLDTGAQGILLAQYAYGDVLAEGYTTVCDFNEVGAGGTSLYRVSEVYDFDYAGTDGSRLTLNDARLLSSDTADFYGFHGIVGMPAMLNRVTSLNNRPMANISFIDVSFNQSLPTSTANRYTIPLSLYEFPAIDGQVNSGDPLPTYAPLPFVDVEVEHSSVSQSGGFILDTGAQMSMISSQIAFGLGLDKNGDQEFTGDEIVGEIPISGVGGTDYLPVVLIDELIVTTDQGVDIVWRNLEMPILDIDDRIDGIFGSDLLTSGWADGLFSGGDGHTLDVHFDFLNSDSMVGSLVLDLNPDFDVVIPEPATAGLVLMGGVALISMHRRKKKKQPKTK